MTTEKTDEGSAGLRRSIEIAYSHRELFNVFPRIFAPMPVRIEGARLTAEDGGKKIAVELEPERTRRLGAVFTLQDTNIHFTFHGYTEAEADAFLRHFLLRTQRGGG